MKKLTLTITLCTFILTSFAQSMDDKIKTLANDIAEQVIKKSKKTVAISIPLYKKGTTEFGEFFAEEVSGKIATSGRNVNVVNQKMLAELLKQNKLTAEGVLIAKNEAAKLGQVSGIEALVYGHIISLREELQISLNIVELKTTNIIGNSKFTVPLTQDLKDLLVQTSITDPGSDPQPSPTNTSSTNCKAENTCTFCVTNQLNQDITTRLYGSKDTKEILINPGKMECWKDVIIQSGEDLEHKRWVVNVEGNNFINVDIPIEACKTYNKIVKK